MNNIALFKTTFDKCLSMFMFNDNVLISSVDLTALNLEKYELLNLFV